MKKYLCFVCLFVMVSFFDSCSSHKNDNGNGFVGPASGRAPQLNKSNNPEGTEETSVPPVSTTPTASTNVFIIENNDKIRVSKMDVDDSGLAAVTFENSNSGSTYVVKLPKDGAITEIATLEDGVKVQGSFMSGDKFVSPTQYRVNLYIGNKNAGKHLLKNGKPIQFSKSNNGKFIGWKVHLVQ
ncbi:MAG: hypothetical protein LBD17_00110 [Endomicrobium sp.]|jgi:hypothetical protein|nr:hypothetical protein [Endomicrobium sp.]